MSRLRQLPNLYGVRGAIATQTMSKMSKQDVEKVGRIVEQIMVDPALAADKCEFMKQLSYTIKGDYRSDPKVAEHEFLIAIWRATVYLLFHSDYNYSCTLCGATEYNTSTHKKKAFDRQYPVCPNCKRALVDGATVSLKKNTAGYHLLDECGNLIDGISGPYKNRIAVEAIVQSPIKTIIGDKKVEDPDKILQDDMQRNKWYSVWIWNYFRQILNENIIRTHNKHEIQTAGPANLIALHLIINELKKNKARYYFDDSTVSGEEFEVLTSTIQFDLPMTGFFVAIKHQYKNFNVDIEPTYFSLKIRVTGEQPIITDTITIEDQVVMVSINAPGKEGSNDDGGWGDIVEFNSTERNVGDLPQIIENDWIATMREYMWDDTMSRMFDILCQNGETWSEFSSEFGDRNPAKIHLVKFLGVPMKKVEEYQEILRQIYTEVNAMPVDN